MRDAIQAFEQPLTVALALFAIMIVTAASHHIWIRWNDRPRPPSFWACIGMLCHWMATGNSRFLEILQDAGKITVATQHFFALISLSLAFTAGVFYFRFLTLHINNWFWKVVSAILLFIIMLLWTVEFLL